MAIEVKHKFVSAKVDTLDNSKVQPSNWNDTHDILLAGGVVVGRAAGGGQAAATEIPMGVTGQALLATANQAAAQAIIGTDATQPTILAAPLKVTPVDADVVATLDSAAANALKRVTWANIKATLKTYFDTLYILAGGTVTALQNFQSSTTVTVLACTGAGNVYLRPNGLFSATGETRLSADGILHVTTDVAVSSDRKLKKSIKGIDLKLAQEAVKNIRGVSFVRKHGNVKSIGFIAQEVQEFFPELVHEEPNGNLSLAYPNMVAVLWETVKQLQKEVEELKSK